jgi:hypothetical protein
MFIVPILLLILLGPGSQAAVGEQLEVAVPEEVIYLALGSPPPSAPGRQVFVPLVLGASEQFQVGTLISEIIFPNALLSFEGVTIGESADLVEAEPTASVQADDENPEQSRLTVTIVSSQGKAIPGGLLAYLTFQVSDQAKVGDSMILEHSASASSLQDPLHFLDPLTARSATIEVNIFDTPFFACLFYMH